MVRIYNNLNGQSRINIKLYREPVCDDIEPEIEELCDIKKGEYKDIPKRKFNFGLPNYLTLVYFDVGGVCSHILSEVDFEGCRKVDICNDNAAFIINVIGGNCFTRIG